MQDVQHTVSRRTEAEWTEAEWTEAEWRARALDAQVNEHPPLPDYNMRLEVDSTRSPIYTPPPRPRPRGGGDGEGVVGKGGGCVDAVRSGAAAVFSGN